MRGNVAPVTRVIATMSLSLDGIGAGDNQTLDRPMGDIPDGSLHMWMFRTPDENRAEMDAIVSAGAYVMGRHMFGPMRVTGRRRRRGNGEGGGATSRCITRPCSCSPTTRANRSRWRAERPPTS